MHSAQNHWSSISGSTYYLYFDLLLKLLNPRTKSIIFVSEQIDEFASHRIMKKEIKLFMMTYVRFAYIPFVVS